VIAVGTSDGFFWATLPIVSNSIFGLKNSGGIYGMLNCFGAVGFISLSLGVQPAVYSSHSTRGMMACDDGVACFRGFHTVCLCYSLVGCAAAIGLVRAVAKQRDAQDSGARPSVSLSLCLSVSLSLCLSVSLSLCLCVSDSAERSSVLLGGVSPVPQRKPNALKTSFMQHARE
jgi:hypothetical protein